MNIDKLMADIQRVKPGRYDCAFSDISAVYNASGGGMEAAANCFNYGFLQGQKAARAEARREKKQRLEQDTSGWYGYLSRWLERNIDNERLLDLVEVFARKLEERGRNAERERTEAGVPHG